MTSVNRRVFIAAGAANAALMLGACTTSNQPSGSFLSFSEPGPSTPTFADDAPASPPYARYASLYRQVDDRFTIAALRPGVVAPTFWRADIEYSTPHPVGTVIVDPRQHYLYHVTANGRATRYGVGVGGEGFGWNGSASVKSKQEWPDWYPPKEMIDRKPEIQKHVTQLQSGMGVAGGLDNPIGARALYLWQGNKDTLYRIHGTNEPHTIGRSVSSGCIRMVNQDAVHLYNRVPVGAKVVVLA